jgi:hypothetical protein
MTGRAAHEAFTHEAFSRISPGYYLSELISVTRTNETRATRRSIRTTVPAVRCGVLRLAVLG